MNRPVRIKITYATNIQPLANRWSLGAHNSNLSGRITAVFDLLLKLNLIRQRTKNRRADGAAMEALRVAEEAYNQGCTQLVRKYPIHGGPTQAAGQSRRAWTAILETMLSDITLENRLPEGTRPEIWLVPAQPEEVPAKSPVVYRAP